MHAVRGNQPGRRVDAEYRRAPYGCDARWTSGFPSLLPPACRKLSALFLGHRLVMVWNWRSALYNLCYWCVVLFILYGSWLLPFRLSFLSNSCCVSLVPRPLLACLPCWCWPLVSLLVLCLFRLRSGRVCLPLSKAETWFVSSSGVTCDMTPSVETNSRPMANGPSLLW